MPLSNQEKAALDRVRQLERARLKAIRANDSDAMALLLDDQFIYINYRGTIYDKDTYLDAVRCHELTYEADVDITETDVRADDNLVILVGQMRGHARLSGENDVYRHANMRVWRKRTQDWKLLAWQSTAPW